MVAIGMAAGKWRRIFFRGIAGILVGIAIIALLLPIWFPWLLRPVARSFGINIGGYRRVSYSRFQTSDVTFSNANVRFIAKSVEASIPSISQKRVDHVAITNWNLQIIPSKASTESRPGKSVYALYEQVRRIVTNVQLRIPSGTATGGRIEVGKEIIEIPRLTASAPRVSADVSFPNQKQQVQLVLTLAPNGRDHVALTNSSL